MHQKKEKQQTTSIEIVRWGFVQKEKKMEKRMSDELKPCPFCGGKAELIYIEHYRECFVKCLKCKVEQGHVYSSKKTAVTAWNRRNK